MATRRPAVVVYLLILINVLAFVWSRALIANGVDPNRFVFAWGLVPVWLGASHGQDSHRRR